MNFSELAGEILRLERDRYPNITRFPLPNQGGMDTTRTFDSLYSLIGNESQTRGTLSSVFWQVVSFSEVFRELLNDIGIDNPLESGGEMILVMHNERNLPRYDLLILSPQLPEDELDSIPVNELLQRSGLRDGDFEDDLARWINLRFSELGALRREEQITEETLQSQRLLVNAIARDFNPLFVEELASRQPYSILFARKSRTVPTNSVARPAWGIALEAGGRNKSTVGVVATNRAGRFGVTACLHGMARDSQEFYDLCEAQGSSWAIERKVYVDGLAGIIRAANCITDSCFIEIDPCTVPGALAVQGPDKKGPRPSHPVMFEGLKSPWRRTYIRGRDYTIPFIRRGIQAKVYTDAIALRGDSGAALIDDDNYVMGFCHYRTAPNEQIEYSEWIWAHSVYDALDLLSPV